jgi:hypothetical protein
VRTITTSYACSCIFLSHPLLSCRIMTCLLCHVLCCHVLSLTASQLSHQPPLPSCVDCTYLPFLIVFYCVLSSHTFASIAAPISAINYFQALRQTKFQHLDEPHRDLREQEQGRNGAQTLGTVAHLAVTSLVALCDTLDSLRHSAALADISKPLSVQCDVTLSLLLQRSTVARSWLLQSNTHEGNTTADGNHLEVHKLSTASTCSALSTIK